MVGDWLVYSSIASNDTMTQKEYDDNRKIIRDGLGTTFDVFLDTKNVLMWRWRHDKFLVIFIRNCATEIGEAHA